KAGHPLKEFLNEDDDNTKDTYLTEINRETTKNMINDWIKMHLIDDEVGEGKLENLEIKLSQDRQNKMSIKIDILENFEDSNQKKCSPSMKLSERSLGFRWFFNFSAKKCYGARSQEKFIYLFDEPGSYLHNSAQSILLKAIKDLSVDHPVIFSTHSEFLLDPEIININKIKIANKSDRQINLVPLSEAKGKRNQGAMTTLYNALRTKISVNSTLSKKVIVFEGITDFYFWKMILPENIVILPGFGAEQNEYLISIAIGTSKRYTAVFDGDNAGDKAIEKYKKFFGNKESDNWIQYCDKNENRILLEGMFSKNDSDRLKKLANLSDLKKTITYIFYSKKDKKAFKKNIDMETKENINKNIMNINKILVTKIPLLTV
ncbi:MAG: hypothetical protein PHS54_03335, partial [Clostridia bacterium]|nr:hypothetical protein [Clostridia bacterium]